ncbi:MAG: hypothetical protein EOS77_24650, partial [Mesorhizobium sp.]
MIGGKSQPAPIHKKVLIPQQKPPKWGFGRAGKGSRSSVAWLVACGQRSSDGSARAEGSRLDAIEKAIRNAFEKGNAEDRAFRERVYRSAFAALDRVLQANPNLTVEAAISRRKA